mmetsp:Transcript_27198/g.69083  ORF Transcript_27198/g.69083 Transcript_27198/m.69083 type:complete len:236 (-) Transcript_27198:217-924(-)
MPACTASSTCCRSAAIASNIVLKESRVVRSWARCSGDSFSSSSEATRSWARAPASEIRAPAFARPPASSVGTSPSRSVFDSASRSGPENDGSAVELSEGHCQICAMPPWAAKSARSRSSSSVAQLAFTASTTGSPACSSKGKPFSSGYTASQVAPPWLAGASAASAAPGVGSLLTTSQSAALEEWGTRNSRSSTAILGSTSGSVLRRAVGAASCLASVAIGSSAITAQSSALEKP